MFEKAAQNEKQRFEGFDFVFEFEGFLENFRRISELERAEFGGGSAFK